MLFRRISALTIVAAFLLLAPGLSGADAVQEWDAIMLSTVATQNPFAQARFAAITQLAVFEAVNAITRDYKSYLGRDIAVFGAASADAAAVAAAHGVLRNYFPGSAATLDAARLKSLSAIPDGPAKVAGIMIGETAAAALVALRANDGAATPETYRPLPGAGHWQPTPPAFAPGALLHWGKLTPFAIDSPAQFRSDPPPALTSSRYRRDFNEVKEVGDALSQERPQDRSDVARFFAATSAAQAWNWAALELSEARGKSLAENARIFALLNMAISDGLVSSMETKYHYHFWRPVTAIRAADIDGNDRTDAAPGFTPLIATPAFPSYPSAHASASYAALEILERIFGKRRVSVTLANPALPAVTLRYARLGDIAEDIDEARIYGGIHFRFDQEAGAVQGRQVGAYVHSGQLCRVKGGCGEEE